MTKTLALVTAIATFLTGTGSVPATPATDNPSRPALVMVDLTPSEQNTVIRSEALFTEAGLQPPAVTIRRSTDIAACDGNRGIHRVVGERNQIDICSEQPGTWEVRVILHELAHAWLSQYLTAKRRDAFQRLRGWKYWLDYNHAAWEDNGAEQAAEIIVWALSDHPVGVNTIHQNSCPELGVAYMTLTGLAPLHGYTDLCDTMACSGSGGDRGLTLRETPG